MPFYPQFLDYYSPYYTTTAATTFTVPTYSNYTPITSTSTLYTTNWTYNTNRYQPIYTGTGSDQVWQQWIALTTEQQVVQERQIHEAHTRRDTARTRARVLLGEFLSEEQKGELEQHGRFHVLGSKGRRYCIRASGQSGNVDLLRPDGSVQATLCAHPGDYVPDGDAWLMQMIELRHDEDHFLQTANVHRGSLAGV